MSVITFDVLAHLNRLKVAGVPELQAKAQLEVMQAAIRVFDEQARHELATKMDLKELELRLLKWQFAGWAALAAIMAKGFGWLGFV